VAQKECIPLYTPGTVLTVQATGDVTAKTFVNISGAMAGGLPKVAPAASGGLTFGVAVRDVKVGGRTTVIRGARVVLPVIAGAAVSAGAEVEVGSFGRAVAAGSGVKVGRALDAAPGVGAEFFIELY
jgi:hypothetical protein